MKKTNVVPVICAMAGVSVATYFLCKAIDQWIGSIGTLANTMQ